jgi:hypothetical protein
MLLADFRRFRATLTARDSNLLDMLASKLVTANRGRSLSRAVETWSRQLKQAAPSLTGEESDALAAYALCVLPNDNTLLQATKPTQEVQMSFNMQFLQLQTSLQHENRVFTTVSNILKTKHDTVKNSINNIR